MFPRVLFAAVVACTLVGTAAGPSTSSSAAGPFLRSNLSQDQIARAYAPADIATAYDFTSLYDASVKGAGQIVALLEADALSLPDITEFDTRFGLPEPSIQEFYVGGKTFTPQTDEETNLDVEWVHALAPDAAIQVYYFKNRGAADPWATLASAVREATTHGARIISISLSTCHTGPGTRLTSSAFSDVMHAGVSVFVSSGDSGARPGSIHHCGKRYGVAYPAGDPSVVAVGGTSLHLNGDGSIQHEVAWRLSGGGKAFFPLHPPWRRAATMPRDPNRWAPDVAFLGDPHTGVSHVFNGHWIRAAGTSLGAPAWAAAWALVRQNAQNDGEAVDVAPRAIYRVGNSSQYASGFHDIVSGWNGKYHAHVGWDAVTGWGTPDVAGLAAAAEVPSATR